MVISTIYIVNIQRFKPVFPYSGHILHMTVDKATGIVEKDCSRHINIYVKFV